MKPNFKMLILIGIIGIQSVFSFLNGNLLRDSQRQTEEAIAAARKWQDVANKFERAQGMTLAAFHNLQQSESQTLTAMNGWKQASQKWESNTHKCMEILNERSQWQPLN